MEGQGEIRLMKLRSLVYIWFIITGFMFYEYAVLHKLHPGPSYISMTLCKGFGYCKTLSPLPGRPLSYTLGWLGFCVMALTNLYVLRKRVHAMQSWGGLQGWLNWHIFFGMLGP